MPNERLPKQVYENGHHKERGRKEHRGKVGKDDVDKELGQKKIESENLKTWERRFKSNVCRYEGIKRYLKNF